MFRPLDHLESYFATMNRHVPTHFVMAVSLEHSTEDERWAAAFRTLQQRHPFLRATIHQESDGRLVFREDEKSAVPVTILARTTPDDWKLIYAELVQQPMPSQEGPLVRMTVLRDAARTDCVVACHHAASDAMGLVYLLRELFSLVNGHELTQVSQQVPLSVKELWAERRPLLQPLSLPQPAPSTGRQYLQNTAFYPEIHTALLSKDDTAALRARAATEKVSVHAALCAAALLAGGRQSVAWRTAPVRMATPVDLRDRLEVGDSFCLALTAFGHSHTYVEGASFWAVAAEIHAVLRASTTDPALLAASNALGALMQAGGGADVLPILVAYSPAYEIMISNLRSLSLEIPPGPLTLDALWGPTTLQQFEGQQSLGVLTFAGQMHLSYASYTIIPGLLDTITTELRGAAQSELIR